MSLTIAVVGQNKAITGGTTLTMDSYVLQSGKEYILAAFAEDPTGVPDIPTCTGWTDASATVFTQQGLQPRITLLRKSGDGSTNANANAITWGSTQNERLYFLIEITGSLTGASLIALVSAGEYTASGVGDVTLGVGSFAMSATSGNAVLAFGYATINGVISIKSGYTALGDQSNALQALGEYKIAQDTTPDFTKPDFTYGVAIAVEIAVSSGGGGAGNMQAATKVVSQAVQRSTTS